MKVLAIEKEINGTTKEQFTPYLKSEAQRVWELHQTGIIREIYYGKSSNNAVLILECADEIEAKKILDTLPLVKENLIKFEILSLMPYDGFARLFKDDQV